MLDFQLLLLVAPRYVLRFYYCVPGFISKLISVGWLHWLKISFVELSGISATAAILPMVLPHPAVCYQSEAAYKTKLTSSAAFRCL